MSDTISYHTEFIRLCEAGNLFEAADSLYISESSLLKHMHILEEEVAHKLFNKCSTRVGLTEYGALYLSFAYRFKALDKELSAKIAELDAKNSSIIKLAIARSMNCDHIVNMLSDHFCERYPNYSISPGEFSRTVNLHQTFHMGYELVFAVGSSTTSEEYDCFQWSSDRMVAILPVDHPLAKRKKIRLSELSNDKFLLFPEGSYRSITYHGKRHRHNQAASCGDGRDLADAAGLPESLPAQGSAAIPTSAGILGLCN